MKKSSAVTQALRTAGIRPTVARVAIYQTIESASSKGASIDDLYRDLPSRGVHAAISTIYRVLSECEAEGLIVRTRDSHGKTTFLTTSDPRVGKIYVRCEKTNALHLVRDQELYARALAAALECGLNWSGEGVVLQALPASTAAMGKAGS